MSYVGNSPTQQSFTGGVDQYNGNASNTVFGLSRTVNTVYDVDVYVENVWQRPTVGYTISANTITFTSAPASGANNVVVVYRNFATTSIIPQQGSVTTSSFAANAIPATLGYVPLGNTSGSITSTLGYTPANKAGDTFTGYVEVGNTVRVTSISNPSSGSGMELAYDGTQGVIQIYSNRSTLASAPLYVGTGQIKFPATQNPSSDANTLDDYEEGTWTPTISGASGTSGQTYSSQTATYIKIGQLVFCNFDVRLSAKGTISGGIIIGGLPFTSKGGDYYGGGSVTYWSGLGISITNIVMQQGNGTNYISLNAMNTGGTSINQPDTTMITNSTILMGMFMYNAAA